jgi:6-phosphogluconolactonase
VNPSIEIFPSPAEVAQAAAQVIGEACRQAVQNRGWASLVLSGGSSPLAVYELLAQEPYLNSLPWPDMCVFWGDERAVPADHAESNYGAWLNHGGGNWPLPIRNLHPMPGDLGAEEGAREYTKTLQEHFSQTSWPQFDLVLLGLGPDGHFASLFPRVPALNESARWVAPIAAPSHIKPHLPRISLTPPVINAARKVLFLVAGASKAQVLARILGPEAQANPDLPASLLNPGGEYTWYLDQEAASLL